MDSMYSKFLDHLELCGGCHGPRNTVTCSYRGVCATAERLAARGIVNNADELRAYGSYELPSRSRRRKDFEYPRRTTN